MKTMRFNVQDSTPNKWETYGNKMWIKWGLDVLRCIDWKSLFLQGFQSKLQKWWNNEKKMQKKWKQNEKKWGLPPKSSFKFHFFSFFLIFWSVLQNLSALKPHCFYIFFCILTILAFWNHCCSIEKSNKNIEKPNKNIENSNKNIEKSNKNIEKSNKTIEKYNKNIEKSNKTIEKSNKNIEKSNKNIEKSNKNIEKSNKNIEKSNKNIEKSNKNIEKSNKNIEKSNKNIEKSNKNIEKMHFPKGRTKNVIFSKNIWFSFGSKRSCPL